MFLFKKKKENPEIQAEAEKGEVKKAAAPPVKVVDKTAKPSKNEKPVKGMPARVVVPAAMTGSPGTPQNPDEIADSLLVKVDPNPEIENAVDDAVVAEVLKPVIAAKTPAGESPASNVKPAASGNDKPGGEAKTNQGAENKPANPAAKTIPPGDNKPAEAGGAPPAEAPKSDQGTKPAESTEKKAPEGEKKAAEGEKKPAETEDKGNMFSNLFGKADVEEETHLDRLIKSLPDVSIEEVINEADEVKNLMNEWFQVQK